MFIWIIFVISLIPRVLQLVSVVSPVFDRCLIVSCVFLWLSVLIGWFFMLRVRWCSVPIELLDPNSAIGTLCYCKIGPVEIVVFPIENGDFPVRYVAVYQKVTWKILKTWIPDLDGKMMDKITSTFSPKISPDFHRSPWDQDGGFPAKRLNGLERWGSDPGEMAPWCAPPEWAWDGAGVAGVNLEECWMIGRQSLNMVNSC